MEHQTNLNGKWWYRLIKVIYILAFVLLFWIPSAATVTNLWPDLDEGRSYYSFKCENGGTYGKFDGYKLLPNRLDFDISYYNLELSRGARLRCVYPELSPEEVYKLARDYSPLTPRDRNYTIIPIEEVYTGSYVGAIFAGVGVLIATLAILLLIRALFFYIGFNQPFWETFLLKKYYNSVTQKKT